MKPLLVALVVATAASAQVLPDEFPSDEPMIDRSTRELTDRHRPFLSALFASSTLSAGPRISQPKLYAGVGGEAGYRFASGNAIGLAVGVQRPTGTEVGLDPVDDQTSASISLTYIHGLGRGHDTSVLREVEVSVGVGVTAFSEGTSGQLSVSPRIAIPLTPVLAIPVGLTMAHELGALSRPGPFVGLTVGVRRIWADRARMVLE